jgi:hypothetical protein
MGGPVSDIDVGRVAPNSSFVPSESFLSEWKSRIKPGRDVLVALEETIDAAREGAQLRVAMRAAEQERASATGLVPYSNESGRARAGDELKYDFFRRNVFDDTVDRAARAAARGISARGKEPGGPNAIPVKEVVSAVAEHARGFVAEEKVASDRTQAWLKHSRRTGMDWVSLMEAIDLREGVRSAIPSEEDNIPAIPEVVGPVTKI